MATDAMNESWKRVMSQIQTIWNEEEFAEADLRKARGDLRKMVDIIHDQTGEGRMEIMQKISAVL